MEPSLLDVKNLKTHLFSRKGVVKAVDDVSIRIRDEEIVGLVGESGCGKTMTGLSIIRLLPRIGETIEGNILFRDEDLTKKSEKEMESIRGKDVSMIFQDPMTFLNPVLKIGDQIGEVLQIHNKDMKKEEIEENIIEALISVGIPSPREVINYYPHQLSGGMRQRVLIASALISGPSLLIADEPTTALDVTIQAQIISLLKKLQKEKKLSILLITHDLGIVSELCDYVYVMYAGRIVEHADTKTLFKDAQHPYTKALLECVISIDEFREKIEYIEGTVPNLIDHIEGCLYESRCPYSDPVCHQKRPPLITINNEHCAACWMLKSRRG